MMKKLLCIILLTAPIYLISAQSLKPYIIGVKSTESVSDIKLIVLDNLAKNGIEVVGQYQPANDKNRWIIIFTSDELESAIKKVGGITGFAAILRIGITSENGKTLVTYTNPSYWGNAYFRDDYPKVSSLYITLSNHLIRSLKASGIWVGTTFGSEKGVSTETLRKYHYMMGMPYFDDTVLLESFDSYQSAISKIESSIEKGVPNIKQVYKVKIPGKNISIYGFAISGEKGESKFLPIVDIDNPKHTAFLPYEILVMDGEVHMLHGRYRIALSFPDLTMGTFSKIMSTPGDIEDSLLQIVK